MGKTNDILIKTYVDRSGGMVYYVLTLKAWCMFNVKGYKRTNFKIFSDLLPEGNSFFERLSSDIVIGLN